MDAYCIWFDLPNGSKDLELAAAIEAYLGRLREEGLIRSYRLLRCKLGFRPSEVGEFFVMIETDNLAQLEEAFQVVARRGEPVEPLHAAVYHLVKDAKFALYRDFPDPVRERLE